MTELCLTLEEAKALPGLHMVFADNIRGIFSLGVKRKTHGNWGHYMWKTGRDRFASQWWYYRIDSLEHYTGCILKFVHNKNWTAAQEAMLTAAIETDIAKPWYKTLYDVPGVIGELLGIDRINIPGLDFCSERGKYLRTVDPVFAEWLKKNPSPSPQQLNDYTKAHQDLGYEVVGRYNAGD